MEDCGNKNGIIERIPHFLPTPATFAQPLSHPASIVSLRMSSGHLVKVPLYQLTRRWSQYENQPYDRARFYEIGLITVLPALVRHHLVAKERVIFLPDVYEGTDGIVFPTLIQPPVEPRTDNKLIIYGANDICRITLTKARYDPLSPRCARLNNIFKESCKTVSAVR